MIIDILLVYISNLLRSHKVPVQSLGQVHVKELTPLLQVA